MTTFGMSPTRPDDFDLYLADWFDGDAPSRAPEGLLDATLNRTSVARPLPVWRLLERWLPVTALAMRRPAVPRAAYVLAIVALVAAALLAALVAGVFKPRLSPIGPAGNGEIVYMQGAQLYAAAADGSAPHLIVTDSRPKLMAMFSNDGTMLAYRVGTKRSPASDPFVYSSLVVANADGTNPRTLVDDVEGLSTLSWSPDSRFLAYTDGEGPTDHAFVVAADGSATVDLGDFGGANGWTPSWAPDSNRLAVAVGDGTLWVINRDGTGARRVSQGTYEEVGEHGASASWSPDGKRLLFTAGKANAGSVYLLSLDGTPERSIAAHADGGVWSPDGSLIAYYTIVGNGARLRIVDANGQAVRSFPGTFGWYMPTWSPDGRSIAMRDDRDDADQFIAADVVILDVQSGVELRRIKGTGRQEPENTHPDWSATWQRVALP